MRCNTCESINSGEIYYQSRSVWSAASLLPLWDALRRSKSAGKPSALQTLREFGCCFAALPLLFFGVASSALSATIPVTNTISQAVDQANEGDTVLVCGPRVFHEHIVLAKSIRLLGTNSPVIDADGSGTPLTITSPDCEARGLVIRNSGHDLGAFDSGIMITGPRTTVVDCHIEVDAFGVYLRGAGECVIGRNEISGRTNLASNTRGNGIHLWKTQRNRILGNTIHDKRDGMYFSYANENVIAGNNIWNTRFGIHYMYSHQNQLLTNSLVRNTVGATMMFSRQSLIAGNVVYANRRHGMVFKQVDNSQVLANIVSGQNRGFFVQQANLNRFEGNIIATNDIGLYLSNCSEENAFVGNSFIRNVDQVWQPPFETGQGRKAPNTFTENRKGNYWSDYTGTDRNRDGIGDTPYHETDVFGYLVDRYPATRIFALSPALTLLRKGEDLLPLLDTPGITDTAPLMFPPTERGRLARESIASLSQR
jgi:nitrous oxidase accessory protein